MKRSIFQYVFSVLLLGASCVCADSNSSILNIAFSEAFFRGVNQNDAIAAMKVWTQRVALERGFEIDTRSAVYDGTEALAEALSRDEIDVLLILSSEMMALRDPGLVVPHFIALRNGTPFEEYLLLVHPDSGITDLAGLKGKKIIVQSNARASLALPWLEEQIRENASLTHGFASITQETKVSKVVLPVFFKTADGCVVTKSSFKTLSEFNPQLSRKLVAVAQSPGFVPTSVSLRTNYESDIREDLLAGLAELHETPHGQQILMLFKVDALRAFDAAMMESVENLLESKKQNLSGSMLLAEKENHE